MSKKKSKFIFASDYTIFTSLAQAEKAIIEDGYEAGTELLICEVIRTVKVEKSTILKDIK